MIGASGSSVTCEDSLTFTLKGYRCDVPIKVMTGDEKLVPGPAGIPVRLHHSIPGGYNHTELTDENGIASFENVPSTTM